MINNILGRGDRGLGSKSGPNSENQPGNQRPIAETGHQKRWHLLPPYPGDSFVPLEEKENTTLGAAHKKQGCKFNKKTSPRSSADSHPSDKNKDVRWMGHSFVPPGAATPVGDLQAASTTGYSARRAWN
jgi:hypothetical protein